MTVAEVFAGWTLGLRVEDVPGDALHAAKRHLLDGFGCALAAERADAVPFVRSILDASDDASVFGLGLRSSPPRAGLANGTLVHALDFDDTHTGALVHATAAVLPAAFAVGQETRATGADVLVAAIAGYEVVIRLGAAVTHGFHARGFHATSVCGVFASALVASKLLGSDVTATTSALGIAGSVAGGSLEFLETGSSTKQLHPGLSALNGIVAARLASAGAEGPASIFEGRYGLYRSYLGVDIEPALLAGELGSRWEVTRITIKPYPLCQLSHASLDALRAAGAVDPEQIERVTFAVPEAVSWIVCGKPTPRSVYEAKFSLEHCAATMLVDGDVSVGSFNDDAIARDEVRALAARIGWIDRPFDGAPGDAPGICEIVLRDGTVLRGEVSKSKGGPDTPLTDDELFAKFFANGGSPQQADALMRLEDLASLEELFT